MEQVGDKPEEVRKHLEEGQAQPEEQQPPQQEERRDEQTEDTAPENGTQTS
jgi:hypothetical protein